MDSYPTSCILYSVMINFLTTFNIYCFYFLDLSRLLAPNEYCRNLSIDEGSTIGQSSIVHSPTYYFDRNKLGND